MGKGTRAAGTRRRAAGPNPAPAQSQGYGQGGGPAQQQGYGQGGYGDRGPGQPQPPAPPRAADRPRKGRGATYSVVMMTLVTLAAVGVLAAQAEATAPKVRANASTASTAKNSGSKSGSSSSSGSDPTALPANSGSGTRIVYSPSAHRAWLVDNSTVERTMAVVPGTVTPPVGSYTVDTKSPGSVGGDGVTVLYVVGFDSAQANTFGFDAESGITGLPPAPHGRTGGIRMAQLDAQLLYEFASVGTRVIVV